MAAPVASRPASYRPIHLEPLEPRLLLTAVTLTDPDSNTIAAPTGTNIDVTFDGNLDTGTVDDTTVVVNALRGRLLATRGDAFSAAGSTLTIDPATDFFPGETVTVNVSTGVEDATNASVDPYVFQFTTTVAGGSGIYADSGQSLGGNVYTNDVALGDIDGDGDLDVFEANGHDRANRVWINQGGAQAGVEGTFVDSGQTLGSDRSYGVSLGDLDGDGDLDAYVANYLTGNRVWFNQGGIQLGTPGVFADSGQSLGTASSTAVCLGDVDGDGDLDAFVANRDYAPERVWLNNGFGFFTDSGQALGSDRGFGVTLGDLDNDGDLDAFVATRDGPDRVWINQGGLQGGTLGAFADNGQTLGSEESFDVSLGDVDGDGDLDAFVGTINSQSNHLWINQGGLQAGTIGTFADSGQTLGIYASYGVSLSDLDGDGDLDMFVANRLDGNRVWINQGGVQAGTLGVFVDTGQSMGIERSQGLAVGDLDGDGDLDAFIGNNYHPNRVWLNVNQDFGDAPDTFGTLTASDGARHNPLGPMLGTSRDAEADGLPTAGADGDDADGSDDEDGVTFIGVITPGVQNAEVSVVVSGGAAVLDAWIDFNGNGTFDVASERIFKGEDVAADTNTLTFDVPADALPGVTYARFRLSTAGVDGPRGYAPDGEIEDYAVTIAPPGGFGIFGSTNQDFGASATMTVAAQDVDGDGDVDILEGNSPAFGDDSRLWLNDGTGVFVDSGLSLGTTDVRGYALGDTDGDGDVDIVVANGSMQPNRVLLNTGTGAFFNSGQTLGTDETFTVALGDVDGDGDLDIADGNSNGPNRIWLNNGAGVFTDSGQVLVDNSFGVESTFSVALADLDNDGDLDIVYGSFGPNRVWLNDGSGVFTNTEQDLGAVGARTYEIAVGDVDDDGDLDIVDGIDNGGTRVWLNDGSAVFSDSGQALNGGAGLTRSVKLGDIDGDGDLDIVEGLTEATVDDSPNLIWLNDGTGLFTNSGQLLGNGDTRSVVLGDFNGDGHLDFFAGNLGDGNVNHLWLNAVDLGDAPDTYGTLLSSDGARHSATGPRLGATRDDDADGAPSVNADGDDTTGIDDEDGVTFDTIMVGALNATVAVNVQGAAGKLDAWIDFNGDGSFGGPGEHIFSSVDVTETDNVLTFDVPSWAVAGVTYARFRLSTAGGLGPRGAAPDGEVEDYAVTITPPSSATSVFTDKQTINVALPGSYPYSVIAADIDGDGDMDIAGALERENTIVWYENDGSQNFIEHVIDSSIRTPKGVFTTDLDGDGDMDVLGAGWRDGLIVWYENDGAQSFTRHTITNQADYVDFVYAADMDNDGDLDVLGATAQKFSWYENSGSESFAEHVVNPSSGDGTSMLAADVDRDGDMDLVTSSLGNDTIAWYENDGSQSFTQRIISTSADGAWAAFAMDIDGDGDMDVLSASYRDDKIAWYENDGSENFTERVISTAADRARSVFAADVDGDGDVDVLSASSNDDKVAWYENNGSETFTERVISTTTNGAWGVFAADMDGDGDMDVVAPARYEGRFVWFEDVGMDFGDAPAPYPTTLTDNGARHISIGPTLGASRDEDLDGAPSVNADGDDSTGIDDEDGVTFGTMMVGALDATVTVNVQGGAGKLDAWIDFNGDGSFGGPGEHVFDSVDVAATDNVLTFDVPSWAIAGVTYARFRLSTAGDLGPSGAAVDGEVEDYAVTIVDPALASGVFGGQNVIDTSTDHPFSVFAADIDGDGDIDMLSASQFDNTIAWYENDGSQNFTAHIISTGALSAFSVFAADVDGDGDVDVLSASYNNSKIAWYENDGAQNFTEHTVGFATGAADVFAADVDGDGDGDLDVLSAAIGGNRIAWYENDGSQSFTAHTITTAANGAISVFAADVDSDGDMDVLSASEFDDKIAWYENDGTQSFTEHAITTTANGAIDVFAADVDGDGDIDVLSAAFLDDAIVWYENDGSQSFTPHTISADADGARSVFAVDIDGDGDIDVLSAEDYDNEIAWYENDGSQSFTPHSISTAASGATSVFAADVDSDGDLDVLSASRNDDKIAWYENLGYDFGDAPSPYPTTLAEDGARHAVTGPTLGGSRDEERDGVHSINADADDLSGDTPDDETGVTFTSVITPGMQDATVSVVVSGGPAKLDAWIDFNGNGTFDVATERIFNSVDVADGTNDLTFDVPADALPGATYARFRLSTAGVAAPYGAAPDGEVEDYAVTVSNPGGTGLFVDGGTTANTLFATDLAVGDLNGDGAVDLFVTHVDDEDEIWLNNGSGVFTVSQSLPVGASRDVVLGDLDSDGDLDAYVIHDDEGNRVWLNDGSGFFTDTGQSLGTYSSLSVTIGDIDGDGDLDVVTGVFDAANHVWLNDGTGFFTDSGQMLGNERTLDVELGDVDGDGDLDLVETCNQAPNRVWLNDGTGVFTDSGQALGTGPTSRSVRLGDVDGDGDLDAVIASYPNSGVWLNDGSGVFTDTGQVLEAGVTPVFDLGDLDGDGDLDLFSVAASGAAGNAWINQGSAQNGTQGVFLTNGQTLPLIAQAQAVELADVDADGDLDALTLGNGDPGRVVLNDNPPVVADQMFDIAEGSAMDASVGAVVASDADTPSPLTFAITGGTGASVFDIDSATGELTVLDPVAIDFDVNTGFTLVVSVTDSVGVAASATMTIDVTNVAPSTPTDADGATNEVSEDATNGTPVGITASSTDPVSGDVFYMLSDDAGGRFQIDESTGVVTVLDGSLLDFDDVTSHMITVRARDTAGLFDEATFTIDVTNAAPSTPIDSDGAANEVSEDATNGTPVGITASASDPVSGDVTYTLSDDAGGAFVIDGDTGVVTLADGSLLNFALANSFDITVRATDPQGAFSEETFSIDVLRAFDLDVDGNGTALPLTDGILLIRFLAGFTGNVLTDGALAGDATRTDPVEILAYLEAAATRFLDVDANGSTLPLTDGILLIRFLAGFTGGVLTDGALAGDATRSDPAEIIAFLSMFQPADPPPPLVIEETPTEPAPLLAADAEPGPTGDAGPPLSALGLVDLLADRDDPQLFADAFANPKVSDGRLRRLLQLDLTPHALSLRDEALTDAVQIIGLV